jgi:hypothetical protein
LNQSLRLRLCSCFLSAFGAAWTPGRFPIRLRSGLFGDDNQQQQQQIPFGDDNQKNRATAKAGQQQRQGNSKGQATAKAMVRAMATARTLPGFGWEDVFPGGIGSLDQLDLLRSGPAFEFFFAAMALRT